VLTRFGYAHGWRTAEAMRDALAYRRRSAHRLQGLVIFEPVEDADACDALAAAR